LLGSPIDTLCHDTLHLLSGNRYQLFWHGGFSPQAPAQLFVREYEDSTAINEASLRLRLFHGASQWESIRLLADTLVQSSVVESVPYGLRSDTLTIPLANEEWLLFSETDSITALQAPLDTLNLNQQNITALTCDDINGSGISLWLSKESGGPMHLLSTLIIPETPVYCDVQWVHASSDTMLHTIDVWINDSLMTSAFSLETASSFTNVQCNDGIITRITKQGNPSIVYFTDTLQLAPNQQHRILLWGIYDSPNYNPAPELDWFIDENFNPASTIAGNTDIRFFHTTGDIGTIQINEASTPIVPFFNEVEVGEMSYTQSLPATQNYGIDVLNAPTLFLFETYALPALEQSWANQSVTLISTGFRQPANNSNGESLQVWALLPDGTMHALQQFVDTKNIASNSEIRVFPNPASETIRMKTSGIGQGIVTVRIIDLFGHVIQERKCTTHQGNIDERFETAFLPSGIYTIHLLSETSTLSSPIVIQH
ncbi:MAG: T9SS type A sorting domain-containing protein, partial [Flavobacteriales bacterium]